MPLHTFLPSPTEVLPLLLPMHIVAAMVMAAAVMLAFMMLRVVTAAAAVVKVMTADITTLFLQPHVLIFIKHVVSGVRLCNEVPV